jgi:integrase
VDPPRFLRKEVRPLTEQQAKAFLQGVRGNCLEALYILATSVGLRQGELLGLKWEDIDFEGKLLQVKRTLSVTKKGMVFVPPKSAKGCRSVALGAPTIEALRRHKTAQEEEKRKIGSLWEDQELVFPNQTGRPMNPWIVTKRFKRILKEEGLPEVRFHDLRHTCATLLLTKGVHPKIVQELLGHSTISVTLDVYSHILPSLQREAVRAMEDIFE